MPKGPNYKTGFTWRHHFDEWWDRRPQEWKAKLWATIVLGFAFGTLGTVGWALHWMERKELLDGVSYNRSESQSPTRPVSAYQPANRSQPRFQLNQVVETRPAE